MSFIDGSVSKGVFVYKGKTKRARTTNYITDNESSPTSSTSRYEICEHIWQTINDRVQILHSDLNTKIFEDLLEFVKKAHDKSFNNTEENEGHNYTVVQEIPTAALVTGINSPDHAVMFQNLHTLLKERLTPFVAELRAKDCANIKTTVSKAVSELMGNTHMDDDESTEDQPNMKRINPTISVLAKWYQDKMKQSKSPTKRRLSPTKRKADNSPAKNLPECGAKNKHSARPPVVFILEDLEAFPPTVLQDFITICSNHLAELPVVLVFGIATSVTTVHRLLSNAASSLLCMEKFQAPPASEYLTLVIDQVVMTDDIPIKLGPKVFNLLLDLFLFHDFSVLNFFRGLQFAVLDHFYTHPYSIICNDYKEATNCVSNLTDTDLKHIRELPSFQNFLEKKENKESSPLKNNKDVKKLISTMLKSLHEYHSCYFPVLRCLHACASRLPKHPLGKQVRELYARSISSPIYDTPEYIESLQLLKSLSRDELVVLLQQCCNNLHCAMKEKEFMEIRNKIQYYIDKFNNIEELQKQADEERNLELAKQEEVIPEKTNLYTLRQTLQSMEMKKKKLSVYESFRSEVFDYLDNDVFRKYLLVPSTLPLQEVFYYNDLSAIRHHIIGSPRATIQWGLGDPHHYLQNECLKTDGDNILSTSPDICIAYKLHLECGRLLNLYDWLQAFMTIITASFEDNGTSSAKKSSKKPKQPNSRVIQARFIRAVSELQFLGFIKPTKRKTDHVARLTWGGC